jgi:hypothetical protein
MVEGNLNKGLIPMSMTELVPFGNESWRQNTRKARRNPLSFRFSKDAPSD